MGVPISKKRTLEWFDEINNVTYLHKPIIGETEIAYYSMLDSRDNDHKPFIDEATKIIDAKKGVKWKQGERIKVITEKAIQLASKDGKQSMLSGVEETNELTNILIVGWKNDVNDLDPFPDDNNPAGCMDLSTKHRFLSSVMGQKTGDKQDIKK